MGGTGWGGGGGLGGAFAGGVGAVEDAVNDPLSLQESAVVLLQGMVELKRKGAGRMAWFKPMIGTVYSNGDFTLCPRTAKHAAGVAAEVMACKPSNSRCITVT